MAVIFILLLVCFCASPEAEAKLDSRSLEIELQKVQKSTDGCLGVGLLDLDTKDSYFVNGNRIFRMQSVAKLPLAIAIFKKIDEGELRLDAPIAVTRQEVKRIREAVVPDDFPTDSKTITIEELLGKTMRKSNNETADILIRLAGGTTKINQSLKQAGIAGLRLDRKYRELVAGCEDAPEELDSATPRALVDLLVKLNGGKILSPSSSGKLMDLMSSAMTGKRRIRGGVPKAAIVAHKTGTGRTRGGKCASTNDVGIVTLKDGRKLVIVVLLEEAGGTAASRDKIIARVTKVACDALN